MAHKNTLGDTLIEVLISIAIVSLVISVSYAVANRSLHQGITASEHTQAIKLAQGQLEELKFREQQSTQDGFLNAFAGGGGNTDYCLQSAQKLDDANWKPVANPNPSTDPSTLNPAEYNGACMNDSKYFMNINIVNKAGTQSALYWVTVKWNAIGGGVNTTQLYYRF